MFGFLKNKIKSAISNIKKEVIEKDDNIKQDIIKNKGIKEESTREDKIEQDKTENKIKKEKQLKEKNKHEKNKKEELKDFKDNKEKELNEQKEKNIEIEKEKTEREIKIKEEKEKSKREKKEKDYEEDKETEKNENKKSLFSKFKDKLKKPIKPIFSKKLTEDQFDKIFWDLEIGLIESNIALEVIEKIKEDLQKNLVDKDFNVFSIDKEIQKSLEKSLTEILSFKVPPLIEKIESFNKKPVVICFFGINGSGKTTTIAKIAKLLKDNGKKVVISASDTFRAAAIDQLEEHANNLGIKIIKHNYGADAAAVAFDTIEHAKAHKIDVVLIDTAGRSHSNANLMDELAKIMRVAKPDIKIFVGDSLTGNDMVEQAKIYSEKIGVDGLILTKTDADEKGGAIISASYIIKKPILFIGTGQGYDDLIKFDKNDVLLKLGLKEQGE